MDASSVALHVLAQIYSIGYLEKDCGLAPDFSSAVLKCV